MLSCGGCCKRRSVRVNKHIKEKRRRAVNWERFFALALNPALDVTLWAAGLEEEFNDIQREQCEAAGKAVNVARVLGSNGFSCPVLLLAGEDNRARYFKRLEQDGVPYEAVGLPGLIRENISLVVPGRPLIRLARPGFAVGREHLGLLWKKLAGYVGPGTMVIVAGKNPRGVTAEDFIGLCRRVQELGGLLALDTSSLSAPEVCRVRPWLIKPNRAELEWMVGRALPDNAAVREALTPFVQSGIAHILVSLGEEGLLYMGQKGEALLARVPRVPVKSAVGAGDNTLSGFLMAWHAGCPLEQCVRVAASFGTASVMRDGTNPARREDLRQVYPQVQVGPLL